MGVFLSIEKRCVHLSYARGVRQGTEKADGLDFPRIVIQDFRPEFTAESVLHSSPSQGPVERDNSGAFDTTLLEITSEFLSHNGSTVDVMLVVVTPAFR